MSPKPTYEELSKRVLELERQVEQHPPGMLSVLMEAFRYIPLCETFEDAAKEIFEHCKRLTGARSGYVALLSENGEENEVLFLDAGGMPCDVDPNLPMPIRGLREIAYKTKDVAYDNSFSESPWIKYMPEGHVRLDNVLFAPLNIEEKTVGIIGIANKPGGFNEKDVYISKILGDLAAVALTYAKSQDSLRDSETKYRHLVSNLPGTAYQFLLAPNGNFRFEYIGENCIGLFGISATDIMTDSNLVFDLIPQPDAGIVHEAIMNSAASLTPYNVEHRILKKNGETVWILASSIPRKLDDGSIIWDGIGLDITGRKQAEQALRESQGNLMSLIDNTDDIIVSRDREGCAIVYNRPFKQIVKKLFDVEAAPGIRTTDYLPEEVRIHWEESLAMVLDSGVRRREEFTWEVDGQARYYEISHSPIQVEGRTIGTTEFTRDITERKEIEEALRTAEKRYSSIFETVSEGIILQDASGIILSWNKGAENIFGISAKEVIGRKSESQDWPTIRENGSRYEGKDHPSMTTLQTGKPCRNEIMGVYKSSGELRWISVDTDPMFSGEDDKPYAVVISFSDITEFKQTVEALADSERKWRNILVKTPQVGISLNPKAEIVFANEHFLSLTGWSVHEVIGQNWFDMFIPEPTREEIRGVFRTIFRKKDASEFTGYENQILTKNGELRTIAWSNVLTKDARGEILDVTCLGIDVSERQRYEKELKESDLKYRQLTETMIETLSVVDLNGVFLYANRNAARNLSDGKLDDITGKNIRQFLSENQAELLIGQYKEVYSSNEPYSQEVLVHFKKGDTWFSNSLKPIDFGPSQVPAILSVSLDITERKNAEVALHESEEKYRVLFNTFPLGITVSDESGNIVEANDMSSELLGISKDKHQDRRIDGPEWRIIRPDGSDMPQDEWASVRALKERRLCGNAEMGIVKPDGRTTWINVTAAPLLLEKYGVVVAYGDITDHKQAEQNYQTLFREMIDGFALHEIIFDKDGQPENYKFLAVNPAFEKMTGLKADKIVGRNVLDVIPDIEPYWIETYGNVALSGEPAYFENYSAAIGKHFQVTAFRPLPGQFACIFADITERKAAENELRESEEKFRNFTEQSFVGFYIIQDDVFKYVNPKFADIFGYTVDECMDGMHFRQLVHTEDLASVQEQVRRRIAGEIDAVQYTFRGVKKSGEIIHVSVYGSALVYQGRPAAIGTMLDITKDLEMEKRLAQSQRMEAIGSLAGGIAHDFNNILFPIVGMSELLLEDLPPDSPEYENAQEIFNAGKRGTDLVKQILAFSRQSEQKKIPIRIQQILKEVTKLSRSTIPVNIDITQDIQSNCSMVQADPTQVHQIAMNLITNAYHAVESTNGTISVRLTETALGSEDLAGDTLQPGRYAKLTVSDTGCGIDPAIMDKIFEPYFTTKEQGKGTGLGLAVVYGIVKEHQGDIKVYSELGRGTTFKVYLPIMAKAEKSSSVEGKEESPTGHERILLVDDEESIAKLEKLMLERLGYRVTMHVNSPDALEAFKTKPGSFDLIISDMTMPQMTGDQLAKHLISIRADIPIIICTGFSERLNQEKAASIGVKGFLMKPIIKSELAKMVRKVLDQVKS